jgi:IS1 family transposase
MLDNRILAEGKALSVLSHLVEGCSVRSSEIVTGVHRDTILNLLNVAGGKCEVLMAKMICGLKVQDVEVDKQWQWIKMKSRTKAAKEITDPFVGDSWTFLAIERHTKLILAWHSGQRGYEDTFAFTEKLAHATSGNFQLSSDGFKAYQDAVIHSLGMHQIDFAQIIKIYGRDVENETRYSPAECIGFKLQPIHGQPDMSKVATSRIERMNLNTRMENRRFTRLSNAASKEWSNHHASLALYFAYYNFCRMHRTLRCTPAMAQGITKSIWTLKDLLLAATGI